MYLYNQTYFKNGQLTANLPKCEFAHYSIWTKGLGCLLLLNKFIFSSNVSQYNTMLNNLVSSSLQQFLKDDFFWCSAGFRSGASQVLPHYTESNISFLILLCFVHREIVILEQKGPCINCCYIMRSTQFSRISSYAEALRFVLTEITKYVNMLIRRGVLILLFIKCMLKKGSDLF